MSIFGHKIKVKRNQVRTVLARRRKAPHLRKPTTVQVPGPMIQWELNGMSVFAPSKSEARAKFKRGMGLKKLPPGISIRRVPGNVGSVVVPGRGVAIGALRG